MNKERCATCGRPRGLQQQRKSWGINLLPFVPRTENPENQPAQMANDLICHAGIYRNGGAGADTHLCDDCLRIGIRELKVHIEALLEDLDVGTDKDLRLAELTQRLASLQCRHYNMIHDLKRSRDRLRNLLAWAEAHAPEDLEILREARYELGCGRAE